MNIYHFLNGYPDIALTDTKTPSVIVTGRIVGEFPLFLREWDPANEGDRREVSASDGKLVGWICATDPTLRWTKTTSDRLVRLLGCPACGRVRGIAKRVKEAGDASKPLAAIRAAWGHYESADVIPVKPQVDEGDRAVSACGSVSPAEEGPREVVENHVETAVPIETGA
jgi:hypothetical protein